MKKCLSAVLLVLLALLCLGLLYRPLAWKDTTGGYLNNIQQLHATGDDQIDLVFVGTSHVYCGVNPTVFWDEKGISAFDLAISSMDKISSRCFLEEFFRTQSPRVLCLDLYSLLFDKQPVQSNEYVNYLALPPSLSNLRSILAYGPEDPLAFLTRFPIIHSRYRELTAFDFVQYPPSTFGRGNYYTFHVESFAQDPDAVGNTQVTPLSPSNQSWLEDILALSREKGFSLVTTVLPFQVTAEEQAILNGAKAYLADQGIPCLDMNTDAQRFAFDYDTDFSDITHLNYDGARKASRYLLEELTARYTFPDHRGDEAYHLWEENSRYDRYQLCRQDLTTLEDPDPAAVLARVGTLPGFTAIVTVPADPDEETLTPALRQTLTAAGVPADQLAEGGQWVLCGGQCLGSALPGGGGLSLDLDAVHNLGLNLDGQQSVELNGVACDVTQGHLSVVLYDNYEYDQLLCAEL